MAVLLAPAVAFVLHDLVLQLPDNQHDASLGFFVTVAGLLLVWGLGGFLVARRGRAAMLRGALAGVVSVLVLWMTFVVLNEFFVDRMSYEPDRIRAFARSGYPTMKEYLHARRDAGPFPVLLGAALIAGAVGGVLGGRARRTAD